MKGLSVIVTILLFVGAVALPDFLRKARALPSKSIHVSSEGGVTPSVAQSVNLPR
jgi:hypothetical protein